MGDASKVVEALIAAGADVNVRSKDQSTPLHSAAKRGRTWAVLALIAAGADTGARDADGRTALDYAVDRGHTEVADLLRRPDAL